jgi:hypothetical protein
LEALVRLLHLEWVVALDNNNRQHLVSAALVLPHHQQRKVFLLLQLPREDLALQHSVNLLLEASDRQQQEEASELPVVLELNLRVDSVKLNRH